MLSIIFSQCWTHGDLSFLLMGFSPEHLTNAALHRRESIYFNCSPRSGGLSLSPPSGLGHTKERLRTAINCRGPSRKPQDLSHRGAWHRDSPCMFKSSLLLMSGEAAGTWHFCKSDFQVFSRHPESEENTFMGHPQSNTVEVQTQICTNQVSVTGMD